MSGGAAEQVDGRDGTRSAQTLLGHTVGGYRIVEELARGGMGVVYLALHPMLGSRVAVKVLREELAADAESDARFLDEARAQARVRHPAVLRVLDLLRLPDGRLCMVLEHVEGESLEQRLRAGRPMPAAEALPVLVQLAGALAAIHRAGVVHGDVKAENVLLTRRRALKLVDFGVARILEEPVPPRTQFATAPCMAPELIRGEEMDARADVYATGILAYRLLSGRYPFPGSSSAAVMLQHLREMPPPLADDVPAALAQVVSCSLAKDREERPANGEALLELLHICCELVRRRRGRAAGGATGPVFPQAPPVGG